MASTSSWRRPPSRCEPLAAAAGSSGNGAASARVAVTKLDEMAAMDMAAAPRAAAAGAPAELEPVAQFFGAVAAILSAPA